MPLRRLWAQCLARAIVQVIWSNNAAAWIDLQMLPKCTLCIPKRGGKSHKSQRLAWTRGKLTRWLAGERSELWQDIPTYKQPKVKVLTKEQRQERCVNLVAEGGLRNACNALIDPQPLGRDEETAAKLADKHPVPDQQVDMSNYGMASSTLVPTIEVDLVECSIRSFHRLSGGDLLGSNQCI